MFLGKPAVSTVIFPYYFKEDIPQAITAKWAEVLDADAFAYLRKRGSSTRRVATKFKEHVLSKQEVQKSRWNCYKR